MVCHLQLPNYMKGWYLTLAGLFEYEEYISLKSINDPNEGWVHTWSLRLWREVLTVIQLRDHQRFDGSARSNRFLPKAHLLELPVRHEQ